MTSTIDNTLKMHKVNLEESNNKPIKCMMVLHVPKLHPNNTSLLVSPIPSVYP